MTEMGVAGVLAPAVLRRDGVGTVVDLPATSLNYPGFPNGVTMWHVVSWVPMDPPPAAKYRSVLWERGMSRGHRPPPELVVGDVIEFSRVTTVADREVHRVRWFGVCETFNNKALLLKGGYGSLTEAIAASVAFVALQHHALYERHTLLIDPNPDIGDLGPDALGY